MKYEYEVISILKGEEVKKKILNEFGQEGWELVAVYNTLHYFKRIIEE